MANNAFAAIALTGGGAGALDDIDHANISDGDMAVVVIHADEQTYHYTYDASEAGAESPPDIIIPDSNSSGTGAWVKTAEGTTYTPPEALVSDYADFATALSTLGSVNPIELVIDEDTALAGNATVTANITLAVAPGNTLDPNGHTLTIKGPIKAGRWKIFETGTVVSHSGRTGQDKVYPEWWGVNSTPGSTDMTAEIQAAIDFAAAGKDGYNNAPDVDLAPTTYYIETPGLSIDTTGVSIGCSSGGRATLLRDNAGGAGWKTLALNEGGSSLIFHNRIHNLAMIQITNEAEASDYHILAEACSELKIENCYLKDALIDIVFKTCVNTRLVNTRIEASALGTYSSGAGYFYITNSTSYTTIAESANVHIDNCNFAGSAASRTDLWKGWGVLIETCDGIWFNNTHIHKSGNIGVYFSVTNPKQLTDVKFSNCYIDAQGNSDEANTGIGVSFNGTSTGGLGNIKFENCNIIDAYGDGASSHGVVFATGSTYNDVIFSNCTISSWGKHGITIAAGNTNIVISGCQIYANSSGDLSPSVYSGIYLSASLSSIVIANNIIGSTVSGSAYQLYGIYNPTAISNAVIVGNLIKGNDNNTITLGGSQTNVIEANNEDT